MRTIRSKETTTTKEPPTGYWQVAPPQLAALLVSPKV